ncbi:MAG TPA: DUF6587 family protein [Steroidobacteraceae bacterium]|jgi:hypothetical protein|nr:DUF6587 family protein [Steroidobacteraceae bacterium]
MSSALDDAVVAVALLASALYLLLALGPRALRRLALSRMAGWAARAPAALRLGGLAARLQAAATKSGACGGCDSCESNAAAGPAGGREEGSEIKIPVGRIGRRR